MSDTALHVKCMLSSKSCEVDITLIVKMKKIVTMYSGNSKIIGVKQT